MEIRVECPHCNQPIEVFAEDVGGQTIPCPGCGSPITFELDQLIEKKEAGFSVSLPRIRAPQWRNAQQQRLAAIRRQTAYPAARGVLKAAAVLLAITSIGPFGRAFLLRGTEQSEAMFSEFFIGAMWLAVAIIVHDVGSALFDLVDIALTKRAKR